MNRTKSDSLDYTNCLHDDYSGWQHKNFKKFSIQQQIIISCSINTIPQSVLCKKKKKIPTCSS